MIPTKHLEKCLRSAPTPIPDPTLLLRLEQLASRQQSPTSKSIVLPMALRWIIPSAGCALLAVIWFVFQQSTSYSLGDTLSALQRIKSYHSFGKTRHGLPKAYGQGLAGHTSAHPDNPFTDTKGWFVYAKTKAGWYLAQSRVEQGIDMEVFNFPMGVEFVGNTRKPFLQTQCIDSLPILESFRHFIGQCDKKNTRKVVRRSKAEIEVVAATSHGEFRWIVDASTYLPKRSEYWSSQFPDHGRLVLISLKYYDSFDEAFGPALFKFALTQDDYSKLAITPEQVQKLRPDDLVLRLEASTKEDYSLSFVQSDGSRKNFSGILPATIIHAASGNTSFDLITSGSARKTIRFQRIEYGVPGKRVVGLIHDAGFFCTNTSDMSRSSTEILRDFEKSLSELIP